MTEEDEARLHHISTETMSFAPGGDVVGGGGMTHTLWSADSVDELVAHYTADLGVEPEPKDGKLLFVQSAEVGNQSKQTVTVIEDAAGHRLAPAEARAIVTVASSTVMRRSESDKPAAPPKQPLTKQPETGPDETGPVEKKRRWRRLWNRRPSSE